VSDASVVLPSLYIILRISAINKEEISYDGTTCQ
jgi:hypothetical protein